MKYMGTAEKGATAPLKPGDLVRTPCGRLAQVRDLLRDGRRECRYLDLDGGEVELRPERLHLVRSAPVLPWKVRIP